MSHHPGVPFLAAWPPCLPLHWQEGAALWLPEPQLPCARPPTQVGSLGALLSPTALLPCPALGSALQRGRRACSRAGRAGGRAAGGVLGSRGLTEALCLGLATRHVRNLSKKEVWNIGNGEQGQCWPGLVGQGTEPGQGAAVPGPAPGKHVGGRGARQGHTGHC